MDLTQAGTTVLAVAAVLGLVAAVVRFFFNRGADERELSVAMRDLAVAVRGLGQKLDGVMVAQHDFDIRLTRIEASSNGSTPAHRDAGSPGRH